MLISLIATLAIQGTGAIHPTANWVARLDTDRCVVSREYGKARVMVEWVPLSAAYSVIIVEDGRSSDYMGHAVLRSSGGVVGTGTVLVSDADSNGQRVVSYTGEGDPRSIGALDTIGIEGKRVNTGTYAIGNGNQIAGVFAKCRDAFVDHWQLDRDALERIATRPKAIDPSAWITLQDFPRAAVEASAAGRQVVLVEVAPDGRVAGCRLIAKAGVGLLDDMICPLFKRRARFSPARDSGGAAITGWYVHKIVWASSRR